MTYTLHLSNILLPDPCDLINIPLRQWLVIVDGLFRIRQYWLLYHSGTQKSWSLLEVPSDK